MKLFTKEINTKLFKQYALEGNLAKQNVVSKIFNPYGRGRWYLVNSDPNDPDYIWAIVQMGDIVEVGSVSRKELETLRVSPWRLPLERDLGFRSVNAQELYEELKQGNFYKRGGWVKDENKQMLLNQAEGFEHHANELESAVKKADHVPAWVVAKSQRATTDLSDITHYLDGENEQKREMEEGEEMASGGYMAKGGEIFTYPNRINEDYDSVNKKWIKEPFTIREGQLIRYKHSPLGSCEAKFLTKVGDKAKIEILEDYEPRTNSEYNEWSGSDEPFGKFKKKVKRGTIKTVNVDKISIVNEDYFKPFQGRTIPISTMLYSPEFKEAFSHLDNKAEGGYMAKGGQTPREKLEVELRRLQRELISPRLSTYREGDVSEERAAIKRERESKLARFNEILEILREDENKMASGGYMAKGGGVEKPYIVWVSKDGKKRERYGDYKSQRAAKMALDKIWKSGEDYVEIGYVSKEEFDKYGYFASGGKVTFDEKVSAVKSSLLKRKKVSPKVQKDYGKTYSPKEAEASAKRIVGAMTAKERLAAKLKKGKK